MINSLPGIHCCGLHSLVSSLTASPTQSDPPLAGAGLVQVLTFVFVPPPQSAEHTVQVKSVHPPLTGSELFFLREYQK